MHQADRFVVHAGRGVNLPSAGLVVKHPHHAAWFGYLFALLSFLIFFLVDHIEWDFIRT